MNSLIVEPEAQHDILDAQDWYESRQAGLGHRLVREIDRALRKVQENPDAFAKVWKDVRRALVRTFPYLVLFVTRGDVIHIIAVIHSARNPQTWIRRAKKFGR